MEKISSPGSFQEDQYAAQVWAQVLTVARVIVVTDGVSREQLRRLHVEHAPTVEKALRLAREKVSDKMKIMIMPDAAYTIPILADN